MIAWIGPALAIAAIGLGLFGFVRLPPRQALAGLFIAFAVALASLRMIAVAIPVALLGVALWQRQRGSPAAPDTGSSEVRTAALAMQLDHDSGDITGEVIDGPLSGRLLDDLSAEEMQDLLAWLEAAEDEDSLSLLMSYLDRRGRPAGGEAASGQPGPLSASEAYRILGLAPGASVEEVRAAYRRLIRRVHPDLGGSTALASMINAAKEVLDPD